MSEDGDRCSICNIYYSYEDLDVVDTVPSEDDDYYGVKEIYVCKNCKEEEQ